MKEDGGIHDCLAALGILGDVKFSVEGTTTGPNHHQRYCSFTIVTTRGPPSTTQPEALPLPHNHRSFTISVTTPPDTYGTAITREMVETMDCPSLRSGLTEVGVCMCVRVCVCAGKSS